MPLYQYRFLEFFGAIGSGTPDDPGSDYGLVCLIEAPDDDQARQWALRVHADFQIARWMFTDTPSHGRLCRVGEIVRIDEADALLMGNDYPKCCLGELPNWVEPWRSCEANGTRPSDIPWQSPKR